MSEPDDVNPYRSPDEVAASAPLLPDESINYPGGFRTIFICGTIVALLIAILPIMGPASFYLGIILYFGSFIALGFALPYKASDLPLRIVGTIILAVLMLVLYVPTCGFTMAIFADGGSIEIAWSIGTIVAFLSSISLGALRVRAVVRKRNPIAADIQPDSWTEHQPFTHQEGEGDSDE
ncbi:MAG: hypothetical protein AAF802_25540 [Planctomycetota bacterium]